MEEGFDKSIWTESLNEAIKFYKDVKEKELAELKGESLAMRKQVYETEQAIDKLNEKFAIITEAKAKELYYLSALGGNDKKRPGNQSIF